MTGVLIFGKNSRINQKQGGKENGQTRKNRNGGNWDRNGGASSSVKLYPHTWAVTTGKRSDMGSCFRVTLHCLPAGIVRRGRGRHEENHNEGSGAGR